jgi:uncharacterized integral membrane protein
MGDVWKKIKIIGGAIVALLIVIVVLQNTESVQTQLLFVSITMPRAALLFGTLLIGFALGVLTAGHLVRKGKSKSSATNAD